MATAVRTDINTFEYDELCRDPLATTIKTVPPM